MRALFLSAGFGKRLRPLTDHIAKPAVPFLNVPMLGYPVFLAEHLGINEAMVNLHHLPETVKQATQSLSSNIDFQFIIEEPNILDSGGGIKNAESFLNHDEDFWVFNGDTICLFDSMEAISKVKSQHQSSGAIATILVCPFPSGHKSLGGVFVKDDTKTIDHFSKTDRGSGLTPYHYIGVCLYSKKIFDYLPANQPSNILYDGVTQAFQDGHRAEVVIAKQARWFETGNSNDYLKATHSCLKALSTEKDPHRDHLEMVLDRFSPHWKSGFTVSDDFTTLIQPGSKISQSARFRGFAVIDKDCEAADECEVKNSVLV
ncbi:MAG: sugar phosphate nucleotidyltransferase, partial [Pseudomonadota bacterium]